MLSRPDILQKAVSSAQAVQAVVRLGVETDSTADGVGNRRTGGAALSVNVSNVDLDGSMVLGGDETVGSRAVGGDGRNYSMTNNVRQRR